MALCDVRRVRNCCFYDYICFGALISWIPTAINAVSTHNLPLGVSSAYHRRIIGVSSTYRESTSLWITEISLPFFFSETFRFVFYLWALPQQQCTQQYYSNTWLYMKRIWSPIGRCYSRRERNAIQYCIVCANAALVRHPTNIHIHSH